MPRPFERKSCALPKATIIVRFAIAAQRLLSGDAQPRSHQAGTCVRRLSRLAPTSGAELRLGGEPERNLSYIAKGLRGRAAWPPLRLSADSRDVRCASSWRVLP